MNERIRELAKQANTYSLSNVNRDSEFFHTIAMAKFAELIVNECAEVAHCNFHVDGLTMGSILKEHFGVSP